MVEKWKWRTLLMLSESDGEYDFVLGNDGLYGQRETMAEAVVALRDQIPPGCDRIEYRGNYLAKVSTSRASCRTATGDEVRWDGDSHAISVALQRLRGAMYRPGVGTWFSVVITVWADGRSQAEFNYDKEPHAMIPPSGVAYLTDQHFFPIDEDKRPEWLKERLAEGVALLHQYGKKSYPGWLVDMIQAGNKPDWL